MVVVEVFPLTKLVVEDSSFVDQDALQQAIKVLVVDAM
jgi:hypothetical protein